MDNVSFQGAGGNMLLILFSTRFSKWMNQHPTRIVAVEFCVGIQKLRINKTVEQIAWEGVPS